MTLIAALLGGLASTAAMAVEIPQNAVLYHYQEGCSKLKAGSPESQKCRADAIAEMERNCATLNTNVLTARPERLANEQRKQALWCGALKQFKAQ